MTANRHKPNLKVEDIGAAILTFENGALGEVGVAGAWPSISACAIFLNSMAPTAH